MLIEHRGKRPSIDPRAYIATTAVLSGDVTIGPDVRVLHGAVLTAEDGAVTIGARCVIMENVVIRGREGHPVVIGDDVLVGPHVHVNGATVEYGSFLATGAAIYPGAVIGEASEIRVHAVVQVNTILPPGSIVPAGWVAVGDPVSILSPDRHDEIWAIQKDLDFPGTVYGITRDTSPQELMTRQSAWFGAHRDDIVV